MTRIACLHTAESNVAVFEAALKRLGAAGVRLGHQVRPELLAAAEAAGSLTPGVARATAEALRGLCVGADAVLLTCSTLGPAVDGLDAPVPVLRTDAALASVAVAGGGRVVVLCAAETTLAPTRALFEAAGRVTGAAVEIRLVTGAWAAFKAGDQTGYLGMIAAAAAEAFAGGATEVALAQASMAGAAGLLAGRQPLDSPAAGLRAVMDQVSGWAGGRRR